jgi:histidine ammonia-lyase
MQETSSARRLEDFILLKNLEDFNLENARRVWKEGTAAAFSEEALRKIENGRKAFERLLVQGRQGFIYGTTTAPGCRATERLSPGAQRAQARTLGEYIQLRPAFGCRMLPQRTARLIVFARLANYVEGNGRIRPVLAQRIADLLTGDLPAVPLGGVACPGEVVPLRSLLDPLADDPLEPGEPMSLVNGSPCAAAFAAECAIKSAAQLELAATVLGLSVEAFGAPLEHYDPALKKLWKDPFERLAIDRMNRLLEYARNEGRKVHQAPVSWRILPRVLGTALRAEDTIREVAAASLASVTDNPVFVFDDPDEGCDRCLSNGGFHNSQAGRAIDGLNAAYADLCVLCAKQTSRLLDSCCSGLPPLLVAEDSGIVGTEYLVWMQNDFAERARWAAAPSLLSMGPEDPEGGHGNVASTAFTAFERHLIAEQCLNNSLAILGVICAEALRHAGAQPAPALEPTCDWIRTALFTGAGPKKSNYDTVLDNISQHFKSWVYGDAGAPPSSVSLEELR